MEQRCAKQPRPGLPGQFWVLPGGFLQFGQWQWLPAALARLRSRVLAYPGFRRVGLGGGLRRAAHSWRADLARPMMEYQWRVNTRADNRPVRQLWDLGGRFAMPGVTVRQFCRCQGGQSRVDWRLPGCLVPGSTLVLCKRLPVRANRGYMERSVEPYPLAVVLRMGRLPGVGQSGVAQWQPHLTRKERRQCAGAEPGEPYRCASEYQPPR